MAQPKRIETSPVFEFNQAARLPAPGDNAAIAIRTLPRGSRILIRQIVFEFSDTVLEGHRFAVHRIEKGGRLLSWGLPFGVALRPIEPGEYLCNEKILSALRARQVDFELPKAPNFSDYRLPFNLDERRFIPGRQYSRAGEPLRFQGYARAGNRGAGTRNYLVLLGTNARSGPFVRELAARLRHAHAAFPNVTGIVPVEHTEGGAENTPLNLETTLRTLAGFMVNPNVAAVLAVDHPRSPITNDVLRAWLVSHDYPLRHVHHRWLSIRDTLPQTFREAEKLVQELLPLANSFSREPLPLRHLKIGLQCGGSDAFSGVSANPLVGIMARETVGAGGSANLAETDELIGAESYVLENVRDLATARSFLEKIERFQSWASWHGHSAEGNPSGGNMYRGLYNISIKAIGAARKKDPLSRLDYVIDFGQPMREPGFYFMDSPGNDLESIAGQVASGCNMILFATGNGSITNFPFVPSIKIMTTTARYELVRNEMDINAGRYLDGEDLESLGREAFNFMVEAASGKKTAGERAGHSQVQLWREWRRDATSSEVKPIRATGTPVLTKNDFPKMKSAIALTPAQTLDLVLPTSLCSGQIALMIAAKLNLERTDGPRAVALPHTEGCGNSGGESEELFMRTLAGYLDHPLVGNALLLEHGCEKTHNNAYRNLLQSWKVDPSRYGWASVQLDGGIDKVVAKAVDWFHSRIPSALPERSPVSVAFFASKPAPAALLEAFWLLAGRIIGSGGSAVVPATLLLHPSIKPESPSLLFGERCTSPGLFTMDVPTMDPVEIITGLAASGVSYILAYEPDGVLPGNPVSATLQISSSETLSPRLQPEADLLISPGDPAAQISKSLESLMGKIARGTAKPKNQVSRNIAFQITRGRTGISL